MCQRPTTTKDGIYIACRTCDDCVSATINDWTARAELEAEMNPLCTTVTLTYRNNPDGSTPRGAEMYDERDVQLWMKRLRAATRAKDKKAAVRFFRVGEMGSINKRVHYHVVLFHSVDLADIGTWKDKDGKEVGLSNRKRLIWSIWPHGSSYVDKGSKDAIRYCLKYTQKERFTEANSRGTVREGKADNWGSAKFVMSKAPPLGVPYLLQLVEEYRQLNALPVSLNIRLPSGGYYYPRGQIREMWVLALYSLAEEYFAKHGQYQAQYAVLLASIPDTHPDGTANKDKETMLYGDVQTTETPTGFTKSALDRFEPSPRTAQIVRTCGRATPCTQCATTKALTQGSMDYDPENFKDTQRYDGHTRGEQHPHCIRIHDPEYNRTFAQRKAAFAFAARQGLRA